jgi:hypothetical protein
MRWFLGFPRRCGRRFIDTGGRRRASWRGRTRGARQLVVSLDRRLKTTASPRWVSPISLIPKQYPGQAPDGLASWAGLSGFSQVSHFSLFSVSFSFFFYFQFWFYSNSNSNVILQVLTWGLLRRVLGYISSLDLMVETCVCIFSYFRLKHN